METPDPIPISALQHWSYCPRQCALIHQEQAFAENVHTARGRAVHALVDEAGIEHRAGLRIERAMPLWSEGLGLVGKADVVEFDGDGTPFPVEYKHGPRRQRLHDELQLAAQALCLEEMTGRSVPAGAIYQHGSRRRRRVAISDELRQAVVAAVAAVRAMMSAGVLPPPANDARCRACSLIELCQPAAIAGRDRYRQLLDELRGP
ncbi:MAG: CRISPR-associated protein Cas4 [Xanthomonadales bacterium]|nr:CRISPR-associated exonuclease Cas4 [Xanthomonadales bacterium]MCC6593490.1 CRISPR-associated protein Cas4 [Xanthomonadales bacterium]MCE7930122.1 CRISPR-associated protein Cas4 [Xanthomonadales bacterium PRO6]